MIRKIISKLIIIFPFVLILAIFYGISTGESWKVEAELVKYYKAVPVAIRDVENIIQTRGKIRAKTTELVLAKVNGVVTKVLVQAGESVSKDQVLANLASESLLEEIEQKKLSLEMDKHSYLSAKNQADLRLKKAKSNYEDVKGLYTLQFASKNELNKALQEYDDAKKETIINTLDSIPTKLEREYLRYKQSELTLASLYKNLESATIKSPMDGIITAIYINSSDSIKLNYKLFEIAVCDELEIHATVGEHDANELDLGMKVEITGDAFANKYKGEVINIGTSSIDLGNDSVVNVIIDIEDEQSEMKHNVQAIVNIFVSSARNVVTVPADAVGVNCNGETVVIEKWWDRSREVFVYIPKPVLVGVKNDKYAQVISEEVQVGIKVVEVYKPELDCSKKKK